MPTMHGRAWSRGCRPECLCALLIAWSTQAMCLQTRGTRGRAVHRRLCALGAHVRAARPMQASSLLGPIMCAMPSMWESTAHKAMCETPTGTHVRIAMCGQGLCGHVDLPLPRVRRCDRALWNAAGLIRPRLLPFSGGHSLLSFSLSLWGPQPSLGAT